MHGYKSAPQLLLHRGENPNSLDKIGRTPIYSAAASGHKDVVQLLLIVGAEPNKENSWGNTPLLLS